MGGVPDPRREPELPRLREQARGGSAFTGREVSEPSRFSRNDTVPGAIAQASYNEPSFGQPSRFSAGPDVQSQPRYTQPRTLSQSPAEKNEDILRNARRALAAGDVQRAAQLADEASRLGLRSDPREDSAFT